MSIVLGTLFTSIVLTRFFGNVSATSEGFFSPHHQAWEQHRFDPVLPELIGSGNLPTVPLRLRPKVASSNRIVFGYLPWWIDKEYFERIEFGLLTHISAFSIEVNDDGSISQDHDWPWTGLINRAHASGVRIVLTATLFGDVKILHLLESDTYRSRFMYEIRDRLRDGQADGVNIDFEGPGINGWPSLINDFMADLTAYLHDELPGCEVSFAAPAVDWAQRWDCVGLAQSCDYLFIMGYAFSGTWSELTGPTAPLVGGGRNIATTLTREFGEVTNLSPEKLILGVPYYGCQWRTASPEARAPTVEFVRYPPIAATLADLPKREPRWDVISTTPWYRYADDDGWMQIWYDDVESLGLKYDMALEKGLAGVGMWALGYEGHRRELWNLIRERVGSRPTTTLVTGTQTPLEFSLGANFPNPFNSVTRIEYELPSPGLVEISVRDVLGRRLLSWQQESVWAGVHHWSWDGRSMWGKPVGSGSYFYSLRFVSEKGKGQLQTRQMSLLR